eukprot:TRINITY_DN579_c0_g1_i11.p1 TRINITY_DN579_c0_g1~~TRINITY_DN579_c0_g1_i11.p1  ORF type:complete len:199 (+),score=39.60 TRINITY_DN579_c0_g1_i11:45-641(+)
MEYTHPHRGGGGWAGHHNNHPQHRPPPPSVSRLNPHYPHHLYPPLHFPTPQQAVSGSAPTSPYRVSQHQPTTFHHNQAPFLPQPRATHVGVPPYGASFSTPTPTPSVAPPTNSSVEESRSSMAAEIAVLRATIVELREQNHDLTSQLNSITKSLEAMQEQWIETCDNAVSVAAKLKIVSLSAHTHTHTHTTFCILGAS